MHPLSPQVRSECPLGQLLAREAALGREIRALDSDMQTLLYENYNKFISATGELFPLELWEMGIWGCSLWQHREAALGNVAVPSADQRQPLQ